ncbi:MAG: acyl-CoA dehydrogenase family protein, partial [Pseudomonadota bacterium]
MDFNDTPEEAAFRAEVNAFCAKHLEPKGAKPLRQRMSGDDFMKRAKTWQAVKADNKFAQITWPKEIGGRGGTPMQQVIWNQEEGKFDAPTGPFTIGLGMCIPTVIAFGSDAHKARYVQKAMRGEEIWCQLFSEPAAGSDVAGVKTRAVKEGDEWVINGQKVWTSGAHYSDFG